PALTLGCGAVGGSSSSDNIGPENLFNIRRIATGVLELEDIRKEENQATSELPVDADALIQSLVEKVLAELK
ncbi:acetaldehyde dehydrogenase, partial [Escherichia coli]|nr:acetaldehyde dehydrogenase [Escherichia coli]